MPELLERIKAWRRGHYQPAFDGGMDDPAVCCCGHYHSVHGPDRCGGWARDQWATLGALSWSLRCRCRFGFATLTEVSEPGAGHCPGGCDSGLNRLMQVFADTLEKHADEDGLTGVERAVFLARGGHAPGTRCPNEPPPEPMHNTWCEWPDDECHCGITPPVSFSDSDKEGADD
jgi:hypothetical protein